MKTAKWYYIEIEETERALKATKIASKKEFLAKYLDQLNDELYELEA